ncbi:MAG: undecaprenyldiphospho-muramoylpentapeptide beta-N-acetylglucosaminyltransferase [Spirochaetaceae bacterium]|jgi:UDP-N-acetylglucosamine--N-acetylmuramyl-(pentapeptide) pyrophosphoryl-undecaprenol N-acetylglucosamine transferase|nr:undecaprenyldiphospho-muramoylpentapeptide beta-N-acetylglucosaminyltransferase [Spirochaetaceae bacterium]
MVHIAFTGGGTGGHIYPGLAVASYLQKQGNCRIFWLGSDKGMDKALVESAGIEFFGIPSGKLRRYLSAQNVSDAFKVGAGFFAARKILKREKPCLLFSKGGFVSVPPCLAAASLGISVFTHESDFSPGLATKINLRVARKIFIAYQESAAFFGSAYKNKIILSGNPVRPEFRSADPIKGRNFLGLKEWDRMLLVLGASQGAQQINELVKKTLPELTKRYTVIHQVGPNTPWSLKTAEKYRSYPFFKDEMPHVLAAAELVLGRSGAGTLWECATVGRPMVLIPLSGSGTRGDQVENARFFETAGAAVTLTGDAASPENLVKTITALAEDEDRRNRMAEASARIGIEDGARLIAETLMTEILIQF